MNRGYHNIERALPSKFYQYVGWDSNGNRYLIEKQNHNRTYRVAQVLALNGTVPYFYARTLGEVSSTLASINRAA